MQSFVRILDAHNLSQHVHQPTHNSGNILDLVMTRQDEQVLHSMDVGSLLVDHYAVKAVMDLPEPQACNKELFFRKLKAIDSTTFNHDLILSDLIVQSKNDLHELLTQYNTMLKIQS